MRQGGIPSQPSSWPARLNSRTHWSHKRAPRVSIGARQLRAQAGCRSWAAPKAAPQGGGMLRPGGEKGLRKRCCQLL
jgi:hypothetical protein